MKKVMVFGTFDIFHEGHRDFLKQARQHGGFVITVVARGKTVKKLKIRKTVDNEKKRLRNIKISRLADEVILGGLGNKYLVIKKYKPDIICLGYDQKISVRELKKKLKHFGLDDTEIVRLKSYYPRRYKSSKLRDVILKKGK